MKNKKLLLVLEAAIQKEEESYALYCGLYEKVEDPTARDTLLFVAEEEKKHREFLVRYRDGQYSPGRSPENETVDYRIAEHLEKPDIRKDMESKDVYLVAAHRELSAHEFYRALADKQPEGEVKEILVRMAREELRHKEKMEYLYANTAFPQTSGG